MNRNVYPLFLFGLKTIPCTPNDSEVAKNRINGLYRRSPSQYSYARSTGGRRTASSLDLYASQYATKHNTNRRWAHNRTASSTKKVQQRSNTYMGFQYASIAPAPTQKNTVPANACHLSMANCLSRRNNTRQFAKWITKIGVMYGAKSSWNMAPVRVKYRWPGGRKLSTEKNGVSTPSR